MEVRFGGKQVDAVLAAVQRARRREQLEGGGKPFVAAAAAPLLELDLGQGHDRVVALPIECKPLLGEPQRLGKRPIVVVEPGLDEIGARQKGGRVDERRMDSIDQAQQVTDLINSRQTFVNEQAD